MDNFLRKKVELFLAKSGKKAMSYKELVSAVKPRRNEMTKFNITLKEMKEAGAILERRNGYTISAALGGFEATVTRVNKTFGFIKRNDDSTEVFIPGKFLMGAMPNDIVIAKLIASRSGSPEGEVLRIIKENKSQFTGTIVLDEGQKYILPDTFTHNLIPLVESDSFIVGDKILAELYSRGQRHSEHKAIAISTFGSSEKASACANSILGVNNISTIFSKEVIDEARRIGSKKITDNELEYRTDLRNELIFTIDGADTKDIDDAISIKKFDTFYELGVHIADVSHYVKSESPLDKEAFERGTSIYYANRVIPMLPPELSNGICSLNPNEDRLAFSCIMTVNFDGKLEDFDFKKTIIRSRVKGVYSEINSILSGNETDEIAAKYENCRGSINLMEELAEILTANKLKRGAPQIETSESKLIINEDDICVGVLERERGKSELIIEEFMLLANQSAATLGKMKGIPFVYRIHENPSEEKIAQLKATLLKMGIEIPHFTTIKPSHLAEIISTQEDTKLKPVVNRLVLRSMAKAKYSVEPIGHFGLVLNDYAHFTSPIRRYPDLSIHRILSELLKGKNVSAIEKRFSAFATGSANQSTERELISMRIERDCEDCYKAEFMSGHVGEKFAGLISSVVEYGFYVELSNTIEGLVHIDSLPHGNYEFDGGITLRDILSGKEFKVGDSINIICTKANVSSGNIDFALIAE